MAASLLKNDSAVLSRADLTGTQGVPVIQVGLDSRLGNFEGLAFVADDHFARGISRIRITTGNEGCAGDCDRPDQLLQGMCLHNKNNVILTAKELVRAKFGRIPNRHLRVYLPVSLLPLVVKVG